MSEEYDKYGFAVDPPERMQQVMRRLFDLRDEVGMADFPSDLTDELNRVRLKFMDEFERRFPGSTVEAVRLGGSLLSE